MYIHIQRLEETIRERAISEDLKNSHNISGVCHHPWQMTLPSGSLIRLNCSVSQRNNDSLDSVYLTFQKKRFRKSFTVLHKVKQTVWKWSERCRGRQTVRKNSKKNHKMVRFTGFKPNSRRRTGDRVSHLKIVVTCRGLSEINKKIKCIQGSKNFLV
jgi:hypothetical protein